MKNILVAVNSFKETADAVEVAELFNKYLDKSLFKVILKPISDGGDGFLEVCRFHFGLEILDYTINTPYDDTFMDCILRGGDCLCANSGVDWHINHKTEVTHATSHGRHV